MSCWTAWTNGSTCGGCLAMTSAATARVVAVGCVGGADCVDGAVAVAGGVAAIGLSFGTGSVVAVGGATAVATGAVGEAAGAWGATSAAAACAAVSEGDAGEGAVIRPARNPIPSNAIVSAAGLAQVGSPLRKGELASESGSGASPTGGSETATG